MELWLLSSASFLSRWSFRSCNKSSSSRREKDVLSDRFTRGRSRVGFPATRLVTRYYLERTMNQDDAASRLSDSVSNTGCFRKCKYFTGFKVQKVFRLKSNLLLFTKYKYGFDIIKSIMIWHANIIDYFNLIAIWLIMHDLYWNKCTRLTLESFADSNVNGIYYDTLFVRDPKIVWTWHFSIQNNYLANSIFALSFFFCITIRTINFNEDMYCEVV